MSFTFPQSNGAVSISLPCDYIIHRFYVYVNAQYAQNIGVYIVYFIHLTAVHKFDIMSAMEKELFMRITQERIKGVLDMPITYKVDVLSVLKEHGYSTYRIRKEKIFGEATLQKFRNREPVSWDNISTLCKLLNCQPGDIMEYVSGDEK